MSTSPSGSKRLRNLPLVLGVLALVAIIVLVVGGVSEYVMPGYGFASQLVRSPEATVAAKKAASDRFEAEKAAITKRWADEEERIRLYNEREAKYQADRKFIRSNTHGFERVYCPDAEKWAALGPEGQQRLRDIMKSWNALLIELKNCP